MGDSVANDIFEGRFTNLNTGEKKEYDLTGEEYGSTLVLFNNVKYATFFDLLEDNMIDILIITDNGSGRQIKAIYNNIDQGNFFLKARMISDEATYAPVRGSAIRAVVTMLNDKKIVVQTGANGQSAYHILQPPFDHIGIGRSNNFIELFTIGLYTPEGKRVLRTWTPIIPKSILFIIADMSPVAENWGLTLLLNPTAKIPLIMICDGVFLLALGLVIIVLHLYEKAEDAREKEEMTTKIFDHF